MVSKTTLLDNTLLSNRYRIVRVIGQGGFGITYEARHETLGTRLAIKEFFLSGKCIREVDGLSVAFQELQPKQFEKYRQRFREEALTLSKLNHPYVVHVHDIFDENGTSYIVMDFVSGENLQEKVDREGALSYDMAVNIMAQLCEAVEHIHKNHILHRDIKPSNIIITPENNVVLIDFGSARNFVHDQEQNHTTMLTIGYAPIEQYTATSKKGNYTDLYAVGGVFYFALTSKKPIPATERLMHDNLPDPRSLNPQVPIFASETIMKALNLQPEDRYQEVSQFREDLLGGNTVVPPSSSSQTTIDNRTSQRKNHYTGWIVAITVILGFIVGVFVMYLVDYLHLDVPASIPEQIVTPVSQKIILDGLNFDISDRRLTEYDLKDKTMEQLGIMRNSFYARYGYAFKDGKYYKYFSQYNWYEPMDNATADGIFYEMTEIEQYNVQFIKKYEKSLYFHPKQDANDMRMRMGESIYDSTEW